MEKTTKGIMFGCISAFLVVCSVISLSLWTTELDKTSTGTKTLSVEQKLPGTDVIVKNMRIKWIDGTMYYSFVGSSKQQDARQRINSLRFRFYDERWINICDAAYVTRIIGIYNDDKPIEQYSGEGKINNVPKNVFREIRNYDFVW